MLDRPLPVISAEVAALASQIEEWRQAKKRRGERMPACLWARAAQLAAQHGVIPVSRAVGICRASLKRHVEAARRPVEESGIAFVEVALGGTQTAQECSIEMFRSDGSSMMLRTPLGNHDLVRLCEAFWRIGC